MNNLLTIRELFQQMEWADARVWAAILARPETAEDAGLRERLYHIHMVQRAFLRVWKDEPLKPPTSGFSDSASLLQWAREYYPEVTGYIGGLGVADLERPVIMPWIEMFEARLGQKAHVPTLYETMLQVAMHSTYHRGQVNTKL